MIWIILISLLLFTLMWIMWAPVIIFLDTETNRYRVTLPGIIRAAVIPGGNLFKIHMWIFFIPIRFDPFRPRKQRKKKDKPSRKRRKTDPSKAIKMGRKVLRAFRIRKMRLDIDTDDFVLNAQLIPVFSAINSDRILMTANFEGNGSFLLDLRTRLGALLWAFFTTR